MTDQTTIYYHQNHHLLDFHLTSDTCIMFLSGLRNACGPLILSVQLVYKGATKIFQVFPKVKQLILYHRFSASCWFASYDISTPRQNEQHTRKTAENYPLAGLLQQNKTQLCYRTLKRFRFMLENMCMPTRLKMLHKKLSISSLTTFFNLLSDNFYRIHLLEGSIHKRVVGWLYQDELNLQKQQNTIPKIICGA